MYKGVRTTGPRLCAAGWDNEVGDDELGVRRAEF